MNFLNPAILFGLIAAALPLIIHLLNLRKLKTIEFSSLQFLKEMQKNKIRRIKLKQILLLIIRTLLIICIVLAFARPAIEGIIPGFESFAKSSNVILIDNSFSMDLSDENGNRFNQAKRIIGEILETMQEGDEVVIIEMANPTETKIYEFTRNKDYLRDELAKIKISFQPADIDKSLKLAAKLLDGATNFSKDIFIVTDAQPNIFTQTEIDKIKAQHTNIYFIPVGYNSTADIRNYSIDSINIRTQIFQVDKTVEIDAFVTNHSANTVNGLLMEMSFSTVGDISRSATHNEFVNVAQRTFDINSRQSRTVSIGATPSTSGVVKAKISLEQDVFPEDNNRYFGFIIPAKPNIAVFGGTPNDFINLAISATGRDGFATVNNFAANQTSSVNLSQFDLVILSGGNFSSSDFNHLKNFVMAGGNGFIFANSQTDINIFSDAMFEFGFGKISLKEFSRNQPNQFITTDKIHPLFEGVFKIDSDSRGVVESPRIYRAMPATAGQSLIEMGGGTFLSEAILGDGKLLYCAVPPTLDWSNFPITGVFPAIIIRAVAYLGSHPELSYNFELGKSTQIMIQKKHSTGGNFRIIDPAGNEFLRQAALLPSGAVLSFDDMNMPGVYTIFNSNNIVVALVSLNLQSSESDFTRFTNSELQEKLNERFAEKARINIITETHEITKSILRARTGTELWRFFILLALLLAAAEMLVQKNFGRLTD